MALEEAGAWLDPELVLPIAGRKFRVPEPSAELGMRLEVLLHTPRESRNNDRFQAVLSDTEERDLYEDVLGPAHAQMVEAGVSYPLLKLAAVTAMYHFVISPETAEAHWNSEVAKAAGKAPKAGASSSSRPATRRTTAAASTTKRRASTSGTRPRRSS